MAEEVITHSAEETTAWGREFAKRLQPPVLVLLSGEMGSGKTTLTKGFWMGQTPVTVGAWKRYRAATGRLP